jgi:hypothetical protein
MWVSQSVWCSYSFIPVSIGCQNDKTDTFGSMPKSPFSLIEPTELSPSVACARMIGHQLITLLLCGLVACQLWSLVFVIWLVVFGLLVWGS